MYDYVTMELRELVEKNLPIASDCRSIMGHSMGGHGALICALKNPGLYKVSLLVCDDHSFSLIYLMPPSECFSVCSNLQPDQLSMGQEGVVGVSWQ